MFETITIYNPTEQHAILEHRPIGRIGHSYAAAPRSLLDEALLMDQETVIPPELYSKLLAQFDVGSPIAENDNLLYEARVETSLFSQVLQDRIDIVRGTKGSGKSALYRVLATFLTDYLFTQRNIAILKGVEATGDPIFLKFKPQFDTLDEIEFQNFWRIYFLSLVNTQFLHNQLYAKAIAAAGAELKEYRRLAQANGFPMAQSLLTYDGLLRWVFAKLPGTKVKASIEPSGAVSGSVELGQAAEAAPEARVPVFVSDLHAALVNVLTKANLNLWIMLDRLDEVFPRRSPIEMTAFRALLKTTANFQTPVIRLKLFLRDDIFDSVTDAPGGFPTLTHILSRCSDTLKWNKDQILLLIMNRVCTSELIARHFKVNKDRLKANKQYREEIFGQIFPRRIRPGKNQSLTLDWIYKHCEDANGVVTPRDVIDLLNLAKTHQQDTFRSQATDMSTLLPASAILYGHRQMSTKKRETYLKAEFDHLWKHIEKFENRRAEFDAAGLAAICGDDSRRIVKDLRSIGFLKYNARTDSYSVPYLYRHCLNMRQGRESAQG